MKFLRKQPRDQLTLGPYTRTLSTGTPTLFGSLLLLLALALFPQSLMAVSGGHEAIALSALMLGLLAAEINAVYHLGKARIKDVIALPCQEGSALRVRLLITHPWPGPIKITVSQRSPAPRFTLFKAKTSNTVMWVHSDVWAQEFLDLRKLPRGQHLLPDIRIHIHSPLFMAGISTHWKPSAIGKVLIRPGPWAGQPPSPPVISPSAKSLHLARASRMSEGTLTSTPSQTGLPGWIRAWRHGDRLAHLAHKASAHRDMPLVQSDPPSSLEAASWYLSRVWALARCGGDEEAALRLLGALIETAASKDLDVWLDLDGVSAPSWLSARANAAQLLDSLASMPRLDTKLVPSTYMIPPLPPTHVPWYLRLAVTSLAMVVMQRVLEDANQILWPVLMLVMALATLQQCWAKVPRRVVVTVVSTLLWGGVWLALLAIPDGLGLIQVASTLPALSVALMVGSSGLRPLLLFCVLLTVGATAMAGFSQALRPVFYAADFVLLIVLAISVPYITAWLLKSRPQRGKLDFPIRRIMQTALATGCFAAFLLFFRMPAYSYSDGPYSLDKSGPPASGGSQIVFDAKIARPVIPFLRTTTAPYRPSAPLYWRGNVYYVLDGATWRRPVGVTGFNSATPYPLASTWEDPSLVAYSIRWNGPLGGHVWLDYPSSPMDLVAVIHGPLPPPPPPSPPSAKPPPPPPPPQAQIFTRDGVYRPDIEDGQRNVRQYQGMALLDKPVSDTGATPVDRTWALGLLPSDTGLSQNPATVAAAKSIMEHLPPGQNIESRAVAAWMSFLDAHTIYDFDRTAYGVKHGEVDAFLFPISGGAGHGTCVDFATASVVALRAMGIQARYVTGFHGATWDPYSHRWVITTGDAHAWVEYKTPASTWLRFDPTSMITRSVVSQDPISAWQMWRQDLIRPGSSGDDSSNDQGFMERLSVMPLPTIPSWLKLAAPLVGLVALFWALRLYLRPSSPLRLPNTLRWAIALASLRLRLAGFPRHKSYGLEAWFARVQASRWSVSDPALAADTQAWCYGRTNIKVSSLVLRWVCLRPCRPGK